MYSGAKLPIVNFQTRVRNNEIEGDNPFEWKTVSSDELFGSGRNVIFSLPGAFTPTCSTYQLPDFERLMSEVHSMNSESITSIAFRSMTRL